MITTILWVATFLSSWRRQKYIGILKCTSKLRSSSESQLNFGRHEIFIVNFAHNEMNRISSNESDVWKLNVAHVLFMQESKFKEATGFYEPIVRKNFDKYVQRSNIEFILISLYIYVHTCLRPYSILNVSAIVLANLCVSYIMTSQNEEAEELMRKIEKEEEQLAYEDPDRKVFHLCIVNLVIGKRNLIFFAT